MLDTVIQHLGEIAAALLALYLAIQKYLVYQSRDNTTIHSERAIAEQFKVLQEALESNRKEAAEARRETAELRLAFARMDRTVHAQQRTITRMEMLLRQFSGLVQESGIVVPAFMQDELQALILPGVDFEGEDRRKTHFDGMP